MKMSRQKCYFCGEQIGKTGSQEHIPPKMLFSAFKGIDKITVYSCKDHNTEKDNRDRVIVSLLLKGATFGKAELDPDIASVVHKLTTMINETEKKNPDKLLIEKLPAQLSYITNKFPYIKAEYDIENWMRMITAGLVYDALKGFEDTINWDNAIVWCPTFVPKDEIPFTDDNFDDYLDILQTGREANYELRTKYQWHEGWESGKNPYPKRIYNFYISFGEKEICFRHQFFNSTEWYVYLEAPRKTVEKIHRNSLR